MKQKAVLILIIAVLGLGFWLWQSSGKLPRDWTQYTDEVNRVSFIYPQSWTVSSIPDFITLVADKNNPEELSVIITLNPSDYFLELAGLTSQAEHLKIGEKDFLISHKEERVRDPNDTSKFTDTVKTFTHLLWIDLDSGAKFWIQISPKQEELDKNLKKIFSSLQRY